ncbi:hypothetical protein SK128_026589 [Halocaridina rubra]|uniref:Uncharacterized protein n=1 Tax=Halocaridina rubra TaxID=373956 RepID=A0AAN9A169_HALRR
MAHTGVPHLSVSSSTPPPSSPPPVRIKSEPTSPQRDQNCIPASHLHRPASTDTGHLSPAPPSHLGPSSNHPVHSLYSNTLSGHLTPTSHASPEAASHHSDYDTPLSKRPRTEGWAT